MPLILFDLDGVLVDSRANMETAWTAVRARFPEAPEFAAYFAEIGRPFAVIMDRLGLAEQAAAIERCFREASAAAPFRVFPGIDDALLAVRRTNAPMGIVTSKDKERTRIVLSRLPVAFDYIGTPNFMRGKPAPDHLLRAMATVGVDPAETVYLGDMAVDAEAARRAGCRYVHATWGYGKAPEGAAVIDRPEDIPSLCALSA